MVLYIAGDIGGTNSRLQLIEVVNNSNKDKPVENIIAEHTYRSGQYVTLTSIVKEFIRDYNKNNDDIAAACFAVAGR